MQKGLMIDLDTTESRGKTRSATMISDSGDIMFDKTMYLLEHNEKEASYAVSALYIYIFCHS